MSSDTEKGNLHDSRGETETESGQRSVPFSKETSESHRDDSAGETQPSEVKPDNTNVRLTGYKFSCCMVILLFIISLPS